MCSIMMQSARISQKDQTDSSAQTELGRMRKGWAIRRIIESSGIWQEKVINEINLVVCCCVRYVGRIITVMRLSQIIN